MKIIEYMSNSAIIYISVYAVSVTGVVVDEMKLIVYPYLLLATRSQHSHKMYNK